MNKGKMKKVLFAENHSIVIRGMKVLFERELAGFNLDIVRNSSDLLNSLKTNEYELMIIDLHLEDGDILHLITTMLNLYPGLNILVFSGNSEEIYAQKLYHEGIMGYLSKEANDEDIIFAITQLLEGKRYMSESFKKYLLTKKDPVVSPFDKLTQREMEVLNLLISGKRPSEICRELNLQSSTVSTYKVKLFTKLQVTNILELNQLMNSYNHTN
jgi:DNA-binding NarL/FixJ family response regulator